MLGGLFYFLPELTPVASPTPIAREQVASASEPEIEPELKITVLQTLPEFASVLIDLPVVDAEMQILKTEMKTGVLRIRYGDTEKHIPIFPNIDSVILHSTLDQNRVILEVSKL